MVIAKSLARRGPRRRRRKTLRLDFARTHLQVEPDLTVHIGPRILAAQAPPEPTRHGRSSAL
jgi:hypothetical protein